MRHERVRGCGCSECECEWVRHERVRVKRVWMRTHVGHERVRVGRAWMRVGVVRMSERVWMRTHVGPSSLFYLSHNRSTDVSRILVDDLGTEL